MMFIPYIALKFSEKYENKHHHDSPPVDIIFFFLIKQIYNIFTNL